MLKNKKSLRFTESALASLLAANKNIKCNVTDLTTLPSVEISSFADKEKKKTKNTEGKDILEYLRKIKESSVIVHETEDSLYIQFEGMKLIPFNQLAQIIQYRAFRLYEYKKALKQKIFDICQEHNVKFVVHKDESVKLFLFRQSERLVDNDTLSISFKYLIDNLRYLNILPEDDPTVIRDIQCFQNKSKQDITALIIKKDRQLQNCLSSLSEFESII